MNDAPQVYVVLDVSNAVPYVLCVTGDMEAAHRLALDYIRERVGRVDPSPAVLIRQTDYPPAQEVNDDGE